MNLKPTAPLGGFVELLPAQQRFVDASIETMRDIARRAGFEHIDLPAIERAEVLTDETDWSETATQMFLFQKGDTKMGLRYDGTVGLARFVAGNMNDLNFPCRLTQFSKRYRGERPQKGRYREFYQMDFDILGIGGLSANYDAEIIKLVADIYKALPEVFGEYVINIGSRTFWNELAKYLGLTKDQIEKVFVLIDRRLKLEAEDWKNGMTEAAGNENGAIILSVFSDGYEKFMGKAPKLDRAITELKEVMALLDSMGVKAAKLDLGTMRGLGYYDGIVYEAISMTYPELGSIGGGGRYGNLVGRFSKTQIIGSGYAIGTNRALITALERMDLSRYKTAVDVAVLIIGQESVAYAMKILSELRDNDIVAVPYLDVDKKFKNQMEFADKINCKFSIIIGEDEVKSNTLTIKDMASGEQKQATLSKAINVVKSDR